MSYNARNQNRAQNQAAAFAAAGYENNLRSRAGLDGLIPRAYAEKKAVGRGAWKPKPAHSYCPNGLMSLSDKGIDMFNEIHPGILPHNLYKAGPAGQGYYDYNLECTKEEKERLVSAHARFSGWMKAASDVPLVVRALTQSVSQKGEGSRRTYVKLWRMAEMYHTPHTLKRRILAVRARARAILAAYDGRGVSLRSVMIALSITRQTGKAALIAAYRSLTGLNARSYREARNALAELHLCKVEDTRDGVSLHRTETPVYQKLGTAVYAAVQKSSSGWKKMLLVVKGDRSYHVGPGRRGYWGHVEVPGTPGYYRCVSTEEPKGAALAAFAAWRKQDAVAKEARERFAHLLRSDVTILVTREDSYQAGNCSPGTESWIYSTGVGRGRWCVPALALLGHADDQRVARVLAIANREAGVWLQKMAA